MRHFYILLAIMLCTARYCQQDGMFQVTGKGDKFTYFTIEDTVVAAVYLPAHFQKPEAWQKAERDHAEREYYGNTYPVTFDLEDALNTIDTSKYIWSVAGAKSWCLHHAVEAFPHLVTRLGWKRKVGLGGTADLIIDDRIGTGELKFYGHGYVIKEDLFTIAGRASWILNELTGEEFAIVHGSMTKVQALEFKKQWQAYVARLK